MATAPDNALVCLGPVKRERGRPSRYSDELADEICARIANGETLTAICEDEDMPARRTVTDWLMRDEHGFAARYARARELQADHEADEIKAISDNAYEDYYIDRDKDGNPVIKLDGESVNRARLRVETRKWRAERLNRRVYGQSVKHEIEPTQHPAAEQLPPGLAWLSGHLPAPEGEAE